MSVEKFLKRHPRVALDTDEDFDSGLIGCSF